MPADGESLEKERSGEITRRGQARPVSAKDERLRLGQSEVGGGMWRWEVGGDAEAEAATGVRRGPPGALCPRPGGPGSEGRATVVVVVLPR